MTLSKLRRALVSTLAMGAMLGVTGMLSTPAQAKSPDETILTIVPFGAGGGTDRWGRVMSSVGFDVFKEGMRIQNRGGAAARAEGHDGENGFIWAFRNVGDFFVVNTLHAGARERRIMFAKPPINVIAQIFGQ